MSAAVLSFPVVETTPPRRVLDRGTHQVLLCPSIKRTGRNDIRVAWSVEETREGSDWWGWIADASSFEEALQIAFANLEPGGVLDCSLAYIENAI